MTFSIYFDNRESPLAFQIFVMVIMNVIIVYVRFKRLCTSIALMCIWHNRAIRRRLFYCTRMGGKRRVREWITLYMSIDSNNDIFGRNIWTTLLVQIISWNNHYSDYSLKFDDYSSRIVVVFHVIDNEKLIEPAFAIHPYTRWYRWNFRSSR